MKRVVIAFASCIFLAVSVRAEVGLQKTPDRGIQPQAVVDAKGNLHLLYYSGDPRGGNLMYVRRDLGKKTLKQPIQVNSQDGSAIAVGTIRGGHLALGKGGRVHVAWNGSMKAEPKNPISGHPMMYTRLNDQGTAFEPQRNLMTETSILDGGGSLAADSRGNVYVAWHAIGKDNAKEEGNRKVWISISKDDGKTFAGEKPAWDVNTGACGCCGLRAFADAKGDAYLIYRAASAKVNRGMYVLRSANQGQTFAGQQLDNWKIDHCPMSSEAFAEGPRGVYVAWDNDGQVFFSLVRSPLIESDSVKWAPGKGGDRKHPALAFNKNGDMILVWTEGAGWNRGGALAWQVYDKSMRPTESGRRAAAIPVWGLPAVFAEANGSFTIFH